MFPLHAEASPGGGRGQALVEFGLVSIVLLVLTAGAIDLGRVFYSTITLNNAARAGALQAARTPASQQNADCTTANRATNLIVCAAEDESKGSAVSITRGQIQISCEGASTSCSATPQPGVRSRVGLTGSFTLATPILAALFGSSTITLSASAVADQVALPAGVVPPGGGGGCGVLAAAFTFTPPSPKKDQLVQFSDLSTGSPVSWAWSFGDTTQNPTHTFTKKDKYDVTLTIKDAANCSVSTTETVTVTN